MGKQLGLGLGVGAVVSLLSWRGNQTPDLVSTFPDAITFAAMVVLLSAAVWYDQRGRNRPASMSAGLTIAATAGVVFGGAVTLLGVLTFTRPYPVLLAYGFLTALGSSLVIGGAASVALSRLRPQTSGAMP